MDTLIEKSFQKVRDVDTRFIRSISAYIVADNIEYGFANKIPLWLFGFLY